ncbi:MAG: T9SS type A sorting domain-containing protein [Candidatus Hatepunaea meridiana]|nr:T9SS type A sorting domain-containing protein [Candidatus Hatepunaea meridiana]
MRCTIILFAIFCIALTTNADLFAQEHEGVEQVSRLYNFWESAHDVVVLEDYAFAATGLSGLQVLDVSDRENPEVITYIDHFGELDHHSHQAMAIQDEVIFLVDESSGLHVFDVRDPEDPREIGFCEVPGEAKDIFIDGDYTYIAAGDSGLYIVDVREIDDPVVVGQFDTRGNSLQVYVIDEIAFVADEDSGLCVIDVSDPEESFEIANFQFGFEAESILVDGNFAYMVTHGRLRVLDISNLTNIQELGRYGVYLPYSCTAISGDHFFLPSRSNNRPDLQILDVSNPEDMFLVGSIDIGSRGGTIWNMFVSDDYAYFGGSLAGDLTGGLITVDISDLENPQEIGMFSSAPGNTFDVFVSGDYAYLASYYSGLRIVNVSDFENPLEVSRIDFPSNWSRVMNIVVEGNNAFLAIQGRANRDNQGLWIIDVSDPENPEEVGHLVTDLFPYSVFVQGNNAYLTTYDGLYIIDISQLDAPQLLSDFELPNNSYYDVFVVGNYAYVTGGRNYLGQFSALHIIDVSNPRNPEQVSQIETPNVAGKVFIINEYAYVTDFEAGMMIIDVSDPEQPQEISLFDTEDYTSGIFVLDKIAYVTDRYKGFRVINVSDKESPYEIGYYDTPGYARGIYVVDNIAFVADHTNLGIYDCSDALDVGDRQNRAGCPSEFFLKPPCPNPFNSTTTITYSLPATTMIKLRLFDLTGREVMTLINDLKQPGVHSTVLNADDLASGLYFVRLEASEQSLTRKVMLIR